MWFVFLLQSSICPAKGPIRTLWRFFSGSSARTDKSVLCFGVVRREGRAEVVAGHILEDKMRSSCRDSSHSSQPNQPHVPGRVINKNIQIKCPNTLKMLVVSQPACPKSCLTSSRPEHETVRTTSTADRYGTEIGMVLRIS